MTLSEATDTVRRMVGRKVGVVRVGEGRGTVVVYVDNMNAARAVRSEVGDAYEGHPITVEKAGLLQVWPSREPVRKGMGESC